MNSNKPRELKCPLCDKKLEHSSKVCPYCGQWISLWGRIIHSSIIPLFVGAIIGVFSVHYGQNFEWKRQVAAHVETQKRINDQTIILLKMELSQNMATLNNIEDLIRANFADLSQDKLTITPLLSFQFEAWNYSRFGKSDFLFELQTANFLKLKNCYFVLGMLANRIKDREQYRLMKEGVVNFKERLMALDRNILDIVDLARKHIKDAQEFLDGIHEWKVQGGSFRQLIDGRVEFIKEE